MKLVEKNKTHLKFSTEIDESLANAIRRYVFHVPVLAIDEIEVSKNDSALYDETIAHRIGLIPLVMPKSVGKDKEFKLELSSKKEGNVYSGEMKGDLKVVYDKIPVTLLEKGQELELVATARLGLGVNHSKFSPGFMVYREMMNVKVEKDCPPEVTDACPVEIIAAISGKTEMKDAIVCDYFGTCVDYSNKQEKRCVSVEPSGELLITVESFGQMDSEEIFKKSIDALKKDLDNLSKEISKA